MQYKKIKNNYLTLKYLKGGRKNSMKVPNKAIFTSKKLFKENNSSKFSDKEIVAKFHL